jgi:hypothetical protein
MCIYVCVIARDYVCVYACVYVCARTCAFVYVIVRVHMFLNTCAGCIYGCCGSSTPRQNSQHSEVLFQFVHVGHSPVCS